MSAKTFMSVYLSALILIIGAITVGANRYELGLVKPSFQAGDCLDMDLSDEFIQHHETLLVAKVGKDHYQLKLLLNGNAVPFSVEHFESADGAYKKVACPALVLEDVGE